MFDQSWVEKEKVEVGRTFCGEDTSTVDSTLISSLNFKIGPSKSDPVRFGFSVRSVLGLRRISDVSD
jgi:hypothetical protein